MDVFSRTRQSGRNKRTFTEMSGSSLNLPRPVPPPLFRADGSSDNEEEAFAPLPQPSSPPTASPPLFRFQGNHRPHPYNDGPFNPIGVMESRRRPAEGTMPGLAHQASQTVIDLTDDNDVVIDSQSQSQSQNRRSTQRTTAPPQLARTDSTTLRPSVISIDSDDDDDDEIEFVSERRLPNARSTLDFPNVLSFEGLNAGAFPSRSPRRPGRVDLRRPSPYPHPNPHSNPNGPGGRPHGSLLSENLRPGSWQGSLAMLMAHMRAAGDSLQTASVALGISTARPTNLPSGMDYSRHAFATPEAPKPEHVPPPAAKEGFTRSPEEDDVIVCPACDEELVAETPEPAVAKTGKRMSRKDREEHPFWVLKECGHVYCNKCYQHRRDKDSKFSQKPGGTKKITICAVEGCAQEVGDKKHWVGVFV